jgi:hypothetical protein
VLRLKFAAFLLKTFLYFSRKCKGDSTDTRRTADEEEEFQAELEQEQQASKKPAPKKAPKRAPKQPESEEDDDVNDGSIRAGLSRVGFAYSLPLPLLLHFLLLQVKSTILLWTKNSN